MTKVHQLKFEQRTDKQLNTATLISLGIGLTAAIAIAMSIKALLIAVFGKTLSIGIFLLYLFIELMVVYYTTKTVSQYAYKAYKGYNVYYSSGKFTLITKDGVVKELDINKWLPQSLKDKHTNTESTSSNEPKGEA